MRNAKVTLWRVGNSEPAAQSYSDAEGRFRFDNLLPGLYDLRIAKAGYRPVNIKRLLKPRENGLTIHATILQKNKVLLCH